MQKDKKYVNVVSFYVSVASVRHERWNDDTAQVPDFICQDLFIWEHIAEDIHTDWKKLARWLCIPDFLLCNIDYENLTVREKSVALLKTWRQMSGKQATVQVLTEVLKRMGRKDLSDKVTGMNVSSSVYPLNSSTFRRQRNC